MLSTKQSFPCADIYLGSTDDARENYDKTIATLAERLGPVAAMRQVHSDKVKFVPSAGFYPECDAIYSDEPNLWLAVSTADCVPILLWSKYCVAAIHGGWRGLADDIIKKTARQLQQSFGTDASDLNMYIGPCIQQSHYEVPADFTNRFPASCFTDSTKANHLLLDLPKAATQQAQQAGILLENITDCGINTYTNTKLYSYRRHKKEQTPFAVQPTLIRLKTGA